MAVADDDNQTWGKGRKMAWTRASIAAIEVCHWMETPPGICKPVTIPTPAWRYKPLQGWAAMSVSLSGKIFILYYLVMHSNVVRFDPMLIQYFNTLPIERR